MTTTLLRDVLISSAFLSNFCFGLFDGQFQKTLQNDDELKTGWSRETHSIHTAPFLSSKKLYTFSAVSSFLSITRLSVHFRQFCDKKLKIAQLSHIPLIFFFSFTSCFSFNKPKKKFEIFFFLSLCCSCCCCCCFNKHFQSTNRLIGFCFEKQKEKIGQK